MPTPQTLLVLIALVTLSGSSIHFTNLKCSEFDSEFAKFINCRLKLVKRGVVALNIYVKLNKTPVNNVTINLSLRKKFSGYRPFMYNVTVDFCQYQRNPKKYPFAKVFFDLMLKDSNVNHTCPYDHDIIVQNMVLNDDMFNLLPLPRGNYMFQLKVGAYNDWKAIVKVYIEFGLSYGD